MVDLPTDDAPHHGQDWLSIVSGISGSKIALTDRVPTSYSQLTRHVGQIVSALEEHADKGAFVALCLARGPELVASVLACWQAGLAYALLDPSTQDGGLREQIAKLNPALIVTQAFHEARVADVNAIPTVCVEPLSDTTWETELSRPASDTPATVHLSVRDPVRSTQTRLSHAQLQRAWAGWQTVYRCTSDDRYFQLTTTPIGAFTTACMVALGAGACLIYTRRRFELGNIIHLVQFLELQGVTVLDCDTGMARRLLAFLEWQPTALTTLRLVLVSGDRFYLDEQQRLQARMNSGVRVLNVYRTTEAPLDCCYMELPSDGFKQADGKARQRSFLGVPFPGMRVELAAYHGERDRATDRGARDSPGETKVDPEAQVLWVAGPQAPASPSAEAASAAEPGGLRATADLVRRDSQGVLEFIGRRDVDVATLSPVDVARAEAALRSHPAVIAGVIGDEPLAPEPAAPRDAREGTRVVCGYVEVSPKAYVKPSEVLRAARQQLPSGIEITRVRIVRALPLTSTGFIDRDTLLRRTPHHAPSSKPALPKRAPRRPRTRPLYSKGGVLAGHEAISPWESPRSLVTWSFPGALVAFLLTLLLWPGSTDVSHVPAPWDTHYNILYLFEYFGFGVGLVYLWRGYHFLKRMGRPPLLTRLSHLSIAWQLLAWWPQDNMYRMTAFTDWGQMALLAWLFNISLIVSAALVATFVLYDVDMLSPEERRQRREALGEDPYEEL